MTARILTALLLAASLAGCSSGSQDARASVTEAESGQTLRLAVGGELVVTLASNPSTGFGWSYRVTPVGILEADGDSEFLADEPVMPGSGGRERFRFTAIGTGTTALEFEYRRAWETEPAAATARYEVVVE